MGGAGLVALDRAVDVAAHAELGYVGHEVVEPEVEDGERPQRPRHVAQLQGHRGVLRRREDQLVRADEHAEVAQLPVHDLVRVRASARVRVRVSYPYP